MAWRPMDAELDRTDFLAVGLAELAAHSEQNCKARGLSASTTASVLALLSSLRDSLVTASSASEADMAACVNTFLANLATLSSLSPHDAAAIVDDAMQAYVANARLLRACAQRTQGVRYTTFTPTIETAMAPPPLSQALPADQWRGARALGTLEADATATREEISGQEATARAALVARGTQAAAEAAMRTAERRSRDRASALSRHEVAQVLQTLREHIDRVTTDAARALQARLAALQSDLAARGGT